MMADKIALRAAYGDALVELGAQNDKIVVMDADLSKATMSCKFAEKFPERFYDFGIAECNMIAEAAGFAHAGLIPFVSTFALFGTGRAFEIIRNTVCYAHANVKFGFSHAGLSVGEDGGSHQSIEDIALMRVLPGMTIFTPCDGIETKKAVRAAAEIDGPVYIRTARLVSDIFTDENTPFVPGKALLLKDGSDVCIIACGLMVEAAMNAAAALEGEGISAAVLNIHTIKPFDEESVLTMAEKCGAVVSVEEHSIIGGLGSAVAETLAGKSSAKFTRIGVMDKFGHSAKPAELFAEHGLTAENIANTCKELLK